MQIPASKDKHLAMGDFLENIVSGSGIEGPEILQKALFKNFEQAINVEWQLRNNRYEAIFYIGTIEYMAIFSKAAELEEYKMFLPVEYLPASIRQQIESKGEIMNVLLINKGNKILYEAIVRNEKKIRKLILMTNTGSTLQENVL
jgi:hypothetical protein